MLQRAVGRADMNAPLTLNISARVAAERAVARGRVWAWVTLYMETLFVLVGAEATGFDRWLGPALLAVALIGLQGSMLRGPIPLALHTPRCAAFVGLCGLFAAGAAAWSGGLGTDRGAGAALLLAPWPLPVMQAWWAARRARPAPPSAHAASAAEAAADPKRRRPWLWRRPRFATAWPWLAAGAAVAGTGVALAVLRDAGVVSWPWARFPQVWIVAAAFLVYRGRRHLQPRADEARAEDPRPPVILLRSFKDDRLPIKRMVWGPRPKFEQLVTRSLSADGPVIAVGEPNEPLPPLGAAREYLRAGDWRAAVDQLIAQARRVVMVLGSTEGLAWELRQTRLRGRLDDLLLLVPPVNEQQVSERWRALVSPAFDVPGHAWQRAAPPSGLLAMVFVADQPVFIVSDRRRDAHYEVAIALARALQDAPRGDPPVVLAHVLAGAVLVSRVQADTSSAG